MYFSEDTHSLGHEQKRGGLEKGRGESSMSELATSTCGTLLGLGTLEVREERPREVLVSRPRLAANPPLFLAPGASSSGVGPGSEPEACREGAPGAQFRGGSQPGGALE